MAKAEISSYNSDVPIVPKKHSEHIFGEAAGSAVRNEKSDCRGHVLEVLRANNMPICRKWSRIRADQSVDVKSDSHLAILQF